MTEEDDVPELSETLESATENIWVLGSRRLPVVDAADQKYVAKLMLGDTADLIPPLDPLAAE